MIRPGRSNRYGVTAGSSGSDTDALQTDVMRFMSILGLCLMAVFALVQSIPMQEPYPAPSQPEREQLHKAIAVQQQRAQVLAAELERLVTQIEQAQSTLQQLVDQTQQTRSERQQLTVELGSLKQQLQHSRYALATLQQATDDKEQSLRALQQRLNTEKQKLDDIRQKARAVKLQQARVTTPPAVRKRPPPPPAPVKKGFTLRFASAEALERQVATGSVSLYAMADRQAWRLSLSNGRPDFAPDTFPKWFHEMAPSTVPAEYVRTLQHSVRQPAQSSVVWGVQLPATTKQGISSLTRGLQGGDLVIGANGQVTLASE